MAAKLQIRIKELETQNETLKNISRDLAVYARRYCDQRRTYCTSHYNEMARTLINMGVELRPDPACNNQIWARDGMGRAYDGLSDEEAGVEKS